MIGNSATLARALDQLSYLALINRPILIIGERGTGKELAAERLHFLSPRWDAPLLKVNCAAIADSLLESELFGHEPGAFTGATRTHHGRFERADGGTLFLDELATMSVRLQEKLLRLVEYGEFERLGGQQTLRVDVRVVAATNVDLKQLAVAGSFREDLLDRLSFDVVHIPSLRHRIEDINELAQHFAMQMCAELGWDLFAGFTATAMAALEQHPWPGNVRELKNAVERSLYRWGDPHHPVDEVVIDPFLSPFADDPVPDAESEQEQSAAPPPPVDFTTRIEKMEQQLLREALRENDHNQRRTAAALGLSYDQLRGMVRKYQLAGRQRKQA
ncbi:MAG: phage shock protein operon transcriptional activator [Gammaproteobacteria bacterium]|nr:MAG: phage shock protein operon transcriptional activator [Gammaproteobacteria bacterium]RLA60492.1 MAG: phage shock protein operon transcriptional activator [Gammaproteobacteria bacterium]